MLLLKIAQYSLLTQLLFGSAFAGAETPPITLPSGEELIQSQLNVREKCRDTRCVESIYKAIYDQIPSQITNSARSGYQKPVQGAKFRDVLDAIVAIDARRWNFNQYYAGSMREVAIRKSGNFIDATGSYASLRGDLKGWVVGRFTKAGSLVCLQYHDQVYCNPAFVDTHRNSPALSNDEFAKGEARRWEEYNEDKRRKYMDIEYSNCIEREILFEDCERYRYKR